MNLELKENHIMHWLIALQKPAIPFPSLAIYMLLVRKQNYFLIGGRNIHMV